MNLTLQIIRMVGKLTIYTFVLTSILFNALLASKGHSQAVKSVKEARISIDIQDVSLTKALKIIENNSDYHFTYQDKELKKDKDVLISVSSKDQTLERLLLEISKQASVSFRQVNDLISVRNSKGIFHKTKVIVDINVSGVITDENGEPLPGATILEKGTANGTTTDLDGNYAIKCSEDATLVISFVGYNTREIALNGRSVVDLSLELDAEQLEEVIVIGYGSVKKSDLTGAVSSIKAEELNAYPAYDISQTLRGRASGVRVTQNSGDPGSRIQVRIRGGNSMIGSNEPLYVVDGFPLTQDITFLNPADIESIEVLKDASATAIYGSRGANGVVLITTKKGKSGKGKISINSSYGIGQVSKRFEMLNARQYAIVANEWLDFNGDPPFADPDTIDVNTDWQDVIYRNAVVQNHTISFSGGNERNQYSISANYYDQEGVIIATGVKRGSLRFALDHQVNDWFNITNNLTLARRQYNRQDVDNATNGSNLFSGALSAPPFLTPYDENGDPVRIEQIYSFTSATMINPVIEALRKDQRSTNSILANSVLELKPVKGLTLRSRLALEYSFFNNEIYQPVLFDGDRGLAQEAYGFTNSFLNENLVIYEPEINQDNALTFTGGFTFQNYQRKSLAQSAAGFSNNTLENYDLGAAESINTPNTGYSEWGLLSGLGRINYTLLNRYLFTASIRSDGSSRFGENNKWGYFPSAAFAWRITDEPFFQFPLINELKLRTSIGKSGNTGLSPYQSLNRLGSIGTAYTGEQRVVGFRPIAIANPDLKWETTTQIDIGVDMEIVDGRYRFTIDYYKKNTEDLLASVPLPPSLGFSSILQNIGEIQNQGIEFSVAADILTGAFQWDVFAQISANRNEVVELAGGNDIFGGGTSIPFNSTINIARVGEPFGVFYGKIETGYDDEGLMTFEDIDGDTFVNDLDRVIIGNPYPDFIYSFNTNFSYKGFDLNAFFEGVQGNDIFFATAGTHGNSFQRGTNQFADLFGNYWTPENTDAKYGRISSSTNYQVSDRFIEDGSYLRLKSLTLAYNIPTESVSWIGSAQLYVSGTNLFTITNYPGLDPEVNTLGSDSGNVGGRLRVGIDLGAYPNSRIYSLGVKLGL